jgi:hypothetical protein
MEAAAVASPLPHHRLTGGFSNLFSAANRAMVSLSSILSQSPANVYPKTIPC